MTRRATGARSLDLTEAHRPDDVLLYAERSGPVPAAAARREVARWERLLDGADKALVRIDAPRSPDQLPAYLAALRLGHAVLLVDGAAAGQAAGLDAAFRPDLVVAGGTVRPGRHPGAADPSPHPELGLLLPTSGSTGGPKVVRLSFDNLRANAQAIVAATAIAPTDRVVTSLPMDFALGLSLVNSHLVAGASVAVSAGSPVTRQFWFDLDRAAATAVGLVPSAVRSLLAWRWSPDPAGRLRRVLLSGGPLDGGTVLRFADVLRPAGVELVRMYGQAEATARIACLPPELLRRYPGSVGRAVPGHEIRILESEGAAAGSGEIEYSGPSVMMGYAWTRRDLVLPDVQGGSLRTGDRGRLEDGLLYVEGRLDRQVKVLGRRVDLDAMEAAASAAGPGMVVAVPVGDDRVLLFCEDGADPGRPGPQDHDEDLRLRSRAAEQAGLPVACVGVRRVRQLPRTGSGKIAYGQLTPPARALPSRSHQSGDIGSPHRTSP